MLSSGFLGKWLLHSLWEHGVSGPAEEMLHWELVSKVSSLGEATALISQEFLPITFGSAISVMPANE